MIKTILLLQFILFVVHGKITECTVNLNNNNNSWKFCAKMGFGQSKIASWSTEAKYSDETLPFENTHIDVLVFIDSQWDRLQTATEKPTCAKMR
jgi:hypothetical protein